MIKEIIVFFTILLINFNLSGQDNCDDIRFQGFWRYLYSNDSLPHTIYKDVPDSMHYCLDDTLSFIMYLGEGIFFGRKKKNKYTYVPSYLPITSHEYRLYRPPQEDLNSSVRGGRGPGEMIPIEFVKIYFISALYYDDLYFLDRVRLGNDDWYIGQRIDGEINKRKDAKLMKDAEKSLARWLILLEEKGIEYMRHHKIDPLHFSELRWQ